MKEKLQELYHANINKFNSVRNKLAEINLGGPFLISPSEKYCTSKKKLIIIGQQTNGWFCDTENIQQQMKYYEDFNLGYNYPQTPFWNVFHKIEKIILNEEYCSVWGNFNKYDNNGEQPNEDMEAEIAKLDFMILEELKILKPDICIFMIGNHFDSRINKLFPGIVFTKLNDWQITKLARLEHQDIPRLTLRTYHPKYLRIKKMEERFLDEVKKQITIL